MTKIQNSKQKFRTFEFRILNLFRISDFGFRISKENSQNGFIALISILIIGAVILTIGIGLSLRSIGETNMALSEELSNQSLTLADACAEHAILQLKNDLNYSGNESIIIGGESCDILAISGSGNLNRIVQSQSTVSGYTKKVRVVVSQISPAMQITSWEEVSDF